MSQMNMEFDLLTNAESNESFGVSKGTLNSRETDETDETKMIVRKLNRSVNNYRTKANPIYAISKEKILKELNAGTMVYFGSMIFPERMELSKVENGKIYGEMIDIKTDGSLTKRRNSEEMALAVEEVIGYETKVGPNFFTKDATMTAKIVDNVHFVNYFNSLTKELREQFLVYATYIANNRLTATDIKRKAIDSILLFGSYTKSVNESQMVEIGYWESFFASKLIIKERKWTIHYFGQDCAIEMNELEEYYKAFMDIVFSEKPLSEMTDFELMGSYLLAGYNLNLDFITGEWYLSKVDSTKRMFLSRAQLNDFKAVEMLWAGLIEKEQKYAQNSLIEDESSYRTIYLNNQNEMKRFVIPTESIVFLPDKYYSVTGHRLYKVLSDDGIYVELTPINRDKKLTRVLGMKDLRMPRKYINCVFSGNGDVKGSIQVPYGIPKEMESTLEQLQTNYLSYINAMTVKEMQQFLLLEIYGRKLKMHQAIREDDECLVEEFAKSSTGISSDLSYLKGLSFVKRNDQLMYLANRKDIESKLSKPEKCYLKEIVVQLEEKKALQSFKEMFKKVTASFEDSSIELTLPELVLAYSIKGMSLCYEGTPTHFIVDGQTVHTTKHDLASIRTMKAYIQ